MKILHWGWFCCNTVTLGTVLLYNIKDGYMNELVFYYDWEITLIKWLQITLDPLGIQIAKFFTLCGDQVLYVLLLGFLYYCWNKDLARYITLNMLVALSFNMQIKELFLRKRPYTVNDSIKCFRPPEAKGDIYDLSVQGYSFPSGHSTNAVTVYSSMAIYLKKPLFTVLGIVMPLLIGLSRIILGVHFPTDVLFGWLTGTIVILLVPWLDKKIPNRYVFYGLIILLASPGWLYARDVRYYSLYGLMLGFLVSVEFEKRFVNFEPTRTVWRCVLRILGGLLIFLLVSTLLKIPVSKDFLDSGTKAAHAFRSFRYMTASFTAFALYPKIFRKKKITEDETINC